MIAWTGSAATCLLGRNEARCFGGLHGGGLLTPLTASDMILKEGLDILEAAIVGN